MEVTNVSICATEKARVAGRPELTPELLAACGARYSRNNEGLAAILSKIDPDNLDKSVDGIFKMIDYGHQSIADMVPVAMFLDNISILQAYLIWSWCPTAGGQESSTRYVRLSTDGLVKPSQFGIPADRSGEWLAFMSECFAAYNKALEFWEGQVAKNPALARIPADLLADPGEKAQKQVARMMRNYAFDRSRYFLPVAALTNMMMVMSARGWAQLCQRLLSHWLPECVELGEKIRSELEFSAPRLMKHATAKDSFRHGQGIELQSLSMRVRGLLDFQSGCESSISLFFPDGVSDSDLIHSLAVHDNRYAFIGEDACRTGVRFAWTAVSMAEIRDLNRHRTGSKFCPLYPVGFYSAADQFPDGEAPDIDPYVAGHSLSRSRELLRDQDPGYVGWLLLGHQFTFEHTTTFDKFVYEAELRTGPGAHYRYAQHLRDVVAKLGELYPDLAKAIKLGVNEPE